MPEYNTQPVTHTLHNANIALEEAKLAKDQAAGKAAAELDAAEAALDAAKDAHTQATTKATAANTHAVALTDAALAAKAALVAADAAADAADATALNNAAVSKAAELAAATLTYNNAAAAAATNDAELVAAKSFTAFAAAIASATNASVLDTAVTNLTAAKTSLETSVTNSNAALATKAAELEAAQAERDAAVDAAADYSAEALGIIATAAADAAALAATAKAAADALAVDALDDDAKAAACLVEDPNNDALKAAVALTNAALVAAAKAADDTATAAALAVIAAADADAAVIAAKAADTAAALAELALIQARKDHEDSLSTDTNNVQDLDRKICQLADATAARDAARAAGATLRENQAKAAADAAADAKAAAATAKAAAAAALSAATADYTAAVNADAALGNALAAFGLAEAAELVATADYTAAAAADDAAALAEATAASAVQTLINGKNTIEAATKAAVAEAQKAVDAADAAKADAATAFTDANLTLEFDAKADIKVSYNEFSLASQNDDISSFSQIKIKFTSSDNDRRMQLNLIDVRIVNTDGKDVLQNQDIILWADVCAKTTDAVILVSDKDLKNRTYMGATLWDNGTEKVVAQSRLDILIPPDPAKVYVPVTNTVEVSRLRPHDLAAHLQLSGLDAAKQYLVELKITVDGCNGLTRELHALKIECGKEEVDINIGDIEHLQSQIVSSRDLVVGSNYSIKSLGNTSFTDLGASSNSVGTVFVATSVSPGDKAVEGTCWFLGADYIVDPDCNLVNNEKVLVTVREFVDLYFGPPTTSIVLGAADNAEAVNVTLDMLEQTDEGKLKFNLTGNVYTVDDSNFDTFGANLVYDIWNNNTQVKTVEGKLDLTEMNVLEGENNLTIKPGRKVSSGPDTFAWSDQGQWAVVPSFYIRPQLAEGSLESFVQVVDAAMTGAARYNVVSKNEYDANEYDTYALGTWFADQAKNHAEVKQDYGHKLQVADNAGNMYIKLSEECDLSFTHTMPLISFVGSIVVNHSGAFTINLNQNILFDDYQKMTVKLLERNAAGVDVESSDSGILTTAGDGLSVSGTFDNEPSPAHQYTVKVEISEITADATFTITADEHSSGALNTANIFNVITSNPTGLSTDGVCTGVSLVGDASGTGALATVTVTSGTISAAVVTTAGSGYATNEVLTATWGCTLTQSNERKEIKPLTELVYLGSTSVVSFTNIEVNATKQMSAAFSQELGNIDTALVSTRYVLKDADGAEETVQGRNQELTTGGTEPFSVFPTTPWKNYKIVVITTVDNNWADLSTNTTESTSDSKSAEFLGFLEVDDASIYQTGIRIASGTSNSMKLKIKRYLKPTKVAHNFSSNFHTAQAGGFTLVITGPTIGPITGTGLLLDEDGNINHTIENGLENLIRYEIKYRSPQQEEVSSSKSLYYPIVNFSSNVFNFNQLALVDENTLVVEKTYYGNNTLYASDTMSCSLDVNKNTIIRGDYIIEFTAFTVPPTLCNTADDDAALAAAALAAATAKATTAAALAAALDALALDPTNDTLIVAATAAKAADAAALDAALADACFTNTKGIWTYNECGSDPTQIMYTDDRLGKDVQTKFRLTSCIPKNSTTHLPLNAASVVYNIQTKTVPHAQHLEESSRTERKIDITKKIKEEDKHEFIPVNYISGATWSVESVLTDGLVQGTDDMPSLHTRGSVVDISVNNDAKNTFTLTMNATARTHVAESRSDQAPYEDMLFGGIVTDTRVLATYEASADDAAGVGYTSASNVLKTFWDLDFTTYDVNTFGFQDPAPIVDNAKAETTFKLGPFIYTSSKPERSGTVSANGGVPVNVSVVRQVLDVNNMMNVYVNDKNFPGKNPNSESGSENGTLIELTSFASEIYTSFTYAPIAVAVGALKIDHSFIPVLGHTEEVDFDPSFTCQVRKKPSMSRVASTITKVGDVVSLNFDGKLTGIVAEHTAVQYDDNWQKTASGTITGLENNDKRLVLAHLSGTWDASKSVEICDPHNNPQPMYELKIVTSPGQTLTNDYSMVLADLNSTNPVNQFDFVYDERNSAAVRPQDGANGANGATTLIYDVLKNTNSQGGVGQDELNLFILFMSKSCGFSLKLPKTKKISVSDVCDEWVDIDFREEMSRDELRAP